MIRILVSPVRYVSSSMILALKKKKKRFREAGVMEAFKNPRIPRVSWRPESMRRPSGILEKGRH